jgi:3-phosphoglycerate kinase
LLSYFGPTFARELEHLEKALEPKAPALFIVGGAKISTKLSLIKQYLDKGVKVFVGGALWWKFQMVWQGVLEGKKSLFSVVDCERIGGALVRSSILAHRGEKDLMEELERIVLSL